MSKIIGIDLGSTNCRLAVFEGGNPVVIKDKDGLSSYPSLVAFAKNGERFFGHSAKQLINSNPEQSIVFFRPEMGVTGKVNVLGKEYYLEHITAMILRSLKERAEEYLGETVSKAVISVPVIYNEIQRQAIRNAGTIAGLDILRVISCPVTAALFYGWQRTTCQKILICDLGAASFDVSILDIGDGVFEVLSSTGNPHVGGNAFDQRIIDYLIDQFWKEKGIDLRKNKIAMQRLKGSAEKAKIELSGATAASISLPSITGSENGAIHLHSTLTREQFNQLTEDLVHTLAESVQSTLKESCLTTDQINTVILTGGSSHIPAIQNAIRNCSGKEPSNGIYPEECVALGAAIQGGVLNGEVKDLMLLDATSISLGVETSGHSFVKLIDRNTSIPTSNSQIFSTASDGQKTIEINILQGESPSAYDNVYLGCLRLTGILPAPKGKPQIEVTFSIDNNGILNIRAKDKATNREQTMTFNNSSAISPEAIEKCLQEEERYAIKSKERLEVSNTLIKADSMISETEKILFDNKEMLSPEDKSTIQSAITAFKKIRNGNSINAIKDSMEEFTRTVYPALGKLFQENDKKREFSKNTAISENDPFMNGQLDILMKLLPVLDNMDLAFHSAENSPDLGLRSGVGMILKQIQAVYEQFGFTEINRLGDVFDPNLEDAVLSGSTKDGKPGTVCQVLRKGYRIGNKVIRHAQVKVVPEY